MICMWRHRYYVWLGTKICSAVVRIHACICSNFEDSIPEETKVNGPSEHARDSFGPDDGSRSTDRDDER